MMSKRWVIAESAPPSLLRQYGGMSAVLAQVLYNRGFTQPEAARQFLDAYEVAGRPFDSRMGMKGLNGGRGAVARIREAIQGRQPIVVYGDFDADGVTSTVLMVQALRAVFRHQHPKAAPELAEHCIKPYIPHRVDEGYGLNSDALRRLARAGAKLIITVDCGIRSVDEVDAGRAAGLDIIVTDHHSIGPEIPNAFAVINPKQPDCNYPEDMLAGVGVAFRLAEALLTVARPRSLTSDDLLDLVAIGTVADLAPLNRAENRALVRRGLERINTHPRPGIAALLEVAGVKPGMVTAETIGYAIGPRINAAGRLESAMLAYDLLATDDPQRAGELAVQLQSLNTQRQDLTRDAQEKIRARLEADYAGDVPLIFASDPHFRPGIVGLVAGRLVEEYFRPAVVMEEGDTESRASCRSIPEFDITRALDACADLLVRHGGHAQAAGFTVRNSNIDALRRRLLAIASAQLQGQDLRPSLSIDVAVETSQLSESLVNELSQLEPTGHLNPAPVLASYGMRVLEARTVGKEGQHLKLKLARAGQPPLDAIGFGLGEWATQRLSLVDVAYRLEINEWNGSRALQLNVQDIRPVDSAK